MPEEEVGALGDVVGKMVLEAGCGAAAFSAALAASGAYCVGVDFSAQHLALARSQVGDRVRLVQGSVDQLPFQAESFDVVFCDYGGVGWVDPVVVIAEAARLLKTGGRFAANTASPWQHICCGPMPDQPARRLREPYFGRSRIAREDEATVFTRTYGEWVRALRNNGFRIEELIELRPEPDSTTSYIWYVDRGWARKWPAEMLWVATRER